MVSTREYLEFTIDTAFQAGRFTLADFQTECGLANKELALKPVESEALASTRFGETILGEAGGRA